MAAGTFRAHLAVPSCAVTVTLAEADLPGTGPMAVGFDQSSGDAVDIAAMTDIEKALIERRPVVENLVVAGNAEIERADVRQVTEIALLAHMVQPRPDLELRN